MNTAADHSETPDTRAPASRWLVRFFLICCGLGLFAAAGIAGGLMALHWLT